MMPTLDDLPSLDRLLKAMLWSALTVAFMAWLGLFKRR
jgi:hypothetical protein